MRGRGRGLGKAELAMTPLAVAFVTALMLAVPTSAVAVAGPHPGQTLEVVKCLVPGNAPRGLPGPNYLYDRVTAPPASAHASLVIDVHWNVRNDEDPGVNAYWALDSYSTNFMVWRVGAGAHAGQYFYVQTFDGQFFAPFSGPKGYAISPDYGTPEPESAVGAFHGAWYGYVWNTTLNSSFRPFFGSLGTMNYGGTVADVELGGYFYPQSGDATPFSWYGYFQGIDPTNAYTQTFSFVYEIEPAGNVWSTYCYVHAAYTPYVDNAYVVGDILTR